MNCLTNYCLTEADSVQDDLVGYGTRDAVVSDGALLGTRCLSEQPVGANLTA
jgi:hypothetical protein